MSSSERLAKIKMFSPIGFGDFKVKMLIVYVSYEFLQNVIVENLLGFSGKTQQLLLLTIWSKSLGWPQSDSNTQTSDLESDTPPFLRHDVWLLTIEKLRPIDFRYNNWARCHFGPITTLFQITQFHSLPSEWSS